MATNGKNYGNQQPHLQDDARSNHSTLSEILQKSRRVAASP